MTKKIFSIVAMLIISLTIVAQKRQLTGTIFDKESGEALMQTTVQVLKSDSTFVTGASTDIDGAFKLTVPASGKYIVRITNIGYKTLYKNITMTNDKNIDLGKLNMATDAVLLKEVVANGVAAKVTVKEDTFIYNAAAYRTPEGSVVEELVRRIPGAKVDDDGNVTINGKSVRKVKVDGKEFMSGDTKTALKNLPTSIIDKIKAYDEKSDLSRITGIDDGDESTVLDFGIKAGMNKGFMMNLDAAVGTNHRYSENLMTMYSKDSFRIIGFGNANNTNDRGFPGGGGRWGGGARNGLNASKMGALGFNYEVPKIKIEGGARWNHQDGDAFSKSSSESFVSKVGSFSNSTNKNFSRSNSWNIQARVEWKPDSMTNIMFRPEYSYSTNDGLSRNISGTYEEDPYLFTDDPLEQDIIKDENGKNIIVNTNQNKSLSYSDTKNASGMLQYNRKLNDKGRNFTARVDAGYNEGASDNISLAELKSRAAGLDDTYNTRLTNRYSLTPTKTTNYTLQGTYSEPIARATFLQFRYQYQYRFNKSDRNTYDFSDSRFGGMMDHDLQYRGCDNFLNNYVLSVVSPLDELLSKDLSRYSEYTTYTHVAELTLRKIHEKYNFTAGFQIQPQRTHFIQDYQGVKADTVRTVTNFSPTLDFRYKYSKVSQLRITYRSNTNQPSMSNLLNVVDDSSPSNISMGNPGLKPSYNHSINAFYNGSRQRYFQSWSANVRFNMTQNSISNMIHYYDKETAVTLNGREYVVPAGGRVTKPENINGDWNVNGDIMFNTAVDTLGNWNINTNTGVGYQNHVGYVSLSSTSDSEKNVTRNLSLSERLSISYRNEWIEVEPNANVTYNHARNKLQASSDLDTWQFSYGMNINITAPWGTSFSTNLSNNCRRGYNEASMNTNELIWNAQVSQSFLRGKPLVVSLQFNDILQQQSNFSRAISAMQRSDTWYNSINSYAMLKVTYRFNAFGGKEARQGMGRRGEGFDGPPQDFRGGRGGNRGGFGGPGGFGGGFRGGRF